MFLKVLRIIGHVSVNCLYKSAGFMQAFALCPRKDARRRKKSFLCAAFPFLLRTFGVMNF